MSISWKLEKRTISDLSPFYKNPRELSDTQAEHLHISLTKFGLIDRPCINLDGTIIGGHQRLNLLANEQKEIEVWIPNRLLDEKEMEELNIRLNKNTGEWDYDILANEWDVQELLKWGFTGDELGFGKIDLIPSEEESEQEHLEPPKDPITKLGDIYSLNNHRIMCGDSTNPDDVKKLLGEDIPILMVTDPPYGVEYDPQWRDKVEKGKRAIGQVKNDDQINWSLAWHLFPGSIAYVWHAGKFAAEIQKNLEEAEYQIINQIIWAKHHFAISRGDYHWQHEPCWYAVKKGHNHNWQGSRTEATLWEIANLNAFGKNTEDERTAHSTQKPLECMRRPIRNNSAQGEQVYDPFLGSGTTLLAAEELKRICFGMELAPEYCDIIVERWIKFMKKHDLPFEVKKNGEKLDSNG